MPEDKDRPIVTQADVARQAGVSRAIVSYVLNNGPRKVSDETRDRVLQAIQELDYRPNKHAQRLKMGTDAARDSIGILAGGTGQNLLTRPYYSVLLAGLFDRAHHFNQHIRFFSFFDVLEDPVIFNRILHPEEVSSLLLLLPNMIAENPKHAEILAQITERIEHIICLELSIFNLPAIIIDLAEAAQMAVEHLIGLGHSRIGFLAINDQRVVGYKRALMMHNIPFDESLMRVIDSEHMLMSAYNLAVELINTKPRITALFAANDESAIAAMAAIHDHGLKVPDDIAVTAIDNTEISAMIRPALTTVNIPTSEMSEYALQFLVSQRNHPVTPPASMLLPIELVIRESCGART